MQVELRIPTKEQFAFIHLHFEGTADEALAEYQRLTDLVNAEGLPDKEWRYFLDHYIGNRRTPNGDGLELWERMSMQQKWAINEIKKTFKRLKETDDLIS